MFNKNIASYNFFFIYGNEMMKKVCLTLINRLFLVFSS